MNKARIEIELADDADRDRIIQLVEHYAQRIYAQGKGIGVVVVTYRPVRREGRFG